MGRAVRAAGPVSGWSGERSKKIPQVRIKRKKRKKELEELHRNVLEAKRNKRVRATQADGKWKSNFSKILNQFADKRRDNADVNETFEDGRSRRKKTICNRLLPEPMVGMFQNGSKGREIHRAVGCLNETNVARLRGNVLKLLKGDETNPKSSREIDEDEKKKKKASSDRPSDDSDKTDCERTIRCLIKDVPILGKTKSLKRINRGKMRIIKEGNETKIEAKDQLTELPRQRDEDKCKRRLFEPDEKDELAKNSFGIIDRTLITDHEIRFSPTRTKNSVVYEKSKIHPFQNMQRVTNLGKSESKNCAVDLLSKESRGSNNFWGWSPVTCYERLCAMISIDNFEKPYHRYRTQDPSTKIQKILRELFTRNNNRSHESKKKISNAVKESSTRIPGKALIATNGENEIYQACTQDSDTEQWSSCESSLTMIGSWHDESFKRYRRNVDANISENDIEKKMSLNEQRMIRTSMIKVNERDVSSSDPVQKTIDSVSKFLKEFNKPKKGKDENMFEMEIEESQKSNVDCEKMDAYPETPRRETKLMENIRCAPKKNGKHVPTILRRTNGHSGSVETLDENEKRGRIFPSNFTSHATKQASNDVDEQYLTYSIPCHHSTLVMSNEKVRSNKETIISPCTSTFHRESNCYDDRTPIREKRKNFVEERQMIDRANARKSKLNFVRAKYEPNLRLSLPDEPEIKACRENDKEEKKSDRNSRKSRHVCANIEIGNNTGKHSSFRQDYSEVMNFQAELAGRREVKEDVREVVAGNKVAFFNRTKRFFVANENEESVERFETSVSHRRDTDLENKEYKTLSNLSLNDRQNSLASCSTKHYSSFEFSLPENGQSTRLIGGPEEILKNKLNLRNYERGIRTVELTNNDLSQMTNLDSHVTKELGTWCYIEADPKISMKNQIQATGNTRGIHENQSNPSSRGSFSMQQDNYENMKKPVILFRPIEETQRRSISNSQIGESRHRDIGEFMTLTRTVRNLRLPGFKDNGEDGSTRRSDRMKYQQPEYRDRQCRISDHLIRENSEAFSQPAKFLAYERTDSTNPHRIPIYEQSDRRNDGTRNEADSSELMMIHDDKERECTGGIYVRSVAIAGSTKKQNLDDRIMEPEQRETTILPARQNCQNYLYNNDPTILVRSSPSLATTEKQPSRRIALMVPHSSVHHLRAYKLDSAPLNLVRRSDFINNDVSKIVYNFTGPERLPVQTGRSKYDSESLVQGSVASSSIIEHQDKPRFEMNFSNREFSELGRVPERIEMPDGRIGIMLSKKSTIVDRSQRVDDDIRRRLMILPSRINPAGLIDQTGTYEFTDRNGIAYSQSGSQWNTVYGSNEQAYNRLNHTNCIRDDYPGM